ncbi:MAG: hypothetical protein OQK45_01095 [Sulfurovum sp.]|nr:hypothetical protein [Sulfurovum sp.]
MKITKQYIVRILLFFYLSSSYLSANHIHNDATEQHSDCKVCLVVKNLHSGDVPAMEVHYVSYTFNDEHQIHHEEMRIKNIYKGFNAHAPPQFS